MSHVRQQIRDAVVTALGSIPEFASVEASRVYTAQQSPACIVYTSNEEANQDTIGRAVDAFSLRRLTLTVEIYSSAGTGQFDAEIDDLCTAVEKQLVNDPTFYTMAQSWEYTGMSVEYSKDASQAGGVASLEYEFLYRIRQDNPEIGV